MDIAMVAIGILFFGLCLVYVRACDRL